MQAGYKNNQFTIEDVNIQSLLNHVGTPCYIYSLAQLTHNWFAWENALDGRDHRVCYAVKANSNIQLLKKLYQLGSGFDVVSIGEMKKVQAAGADLHKTVFSGVGKQAHEIEYALNANIYCINVESSEELSLLTHIAKQLNICAPIALRLNPQVAVDSHRYLATGTEQDKFGIDRDTFIDLAKQALVSPHLNLMGMSVHVGSQLKDSSALVHALGHVKACLNELPSNFKLRYLNIGGGLGIAYQQDQCFPSPSLFLEPVWAHLPEGNYTLVTEPGRSLIANAGWLGTKVLYEKHTPAKQFLVVDAAMNDLMRPALYQATHGVLPVQQHSKPATRYSIVGPVCESGDILLENALLSVAPDDYLLFQDSGAYAFSMSSNYNSRLRACEVLIDRDHAYIIRERESYEGLIQAEMQQNRIAL